MDNPIIENYRGIPIRKYPKINIRCSVPEMKKLIDAKLDLGMSPKEAIESKKVFCHNCNGIDIKKYNAKGY